MNLVEFLTTQVFTVNGEPLDLTLARKLPMNPQDAQLITLPFEDYEVFFGRHKGAPGTLAMRWPGLFKAEIVEALHPNTSHDYARYLICLKLLENHIYHYARPRWEDNGDPCFNEGEALENAKKLYRPYVVTEDLS